MNLGVALALILGFGLVLIFIISSSGRKKASQKHHREVLNKKVVQERWEQIENTYNLGGQSHFKSAILDADKLVDHVLRRLNIAGETMGERLKNVKNKFRKYEDYNNLWFAHKVRNNIAHQVDHEVFSAEAKKAIGYYKKALKELGLL